MPRKFYIDLKVTEINGTTKAICMLKIINFLCRLARMKVTIDVTTRWEEADTKTKIGKIEMESSNEPEAA